MSHLAHHVATAAAAAVAPMAVAGTGAAAEARGMCLSEPGTRCRLLGLGIDAGVWHALEDPWDVALLNHKALGLLPVRRKSAYGLGFNVIHA